MSDPLNEIRKKDAINELSRALDSLYAARLALDTAGAIEEANRVIAASREVGAILEVVRAKEF